MQLEWEVPRGHARVVDDDNDMDEHVVASGWYPEVKPSQVSAVLKHEAEALQTNVNL